MQYNIPSVVIGSCSHALANTRTLGRKKIPTFLVSKGRGFPATKTKYANTIFIEDTNTEVLIPNLINIRKRFSEKPVLFPTNDKMVRLIALHFDEVSKYYRLNWPDPQLMLSLLDKKQLEYFVRKAGLQYPKTYLFENLENLSSILSSLTYPAILKPSQPLSAFKATIILNEQQLVREFQLYSGKIDWFLLQEWIPGTDRDIYFVNFYFDHNAKPIAHFTGRKIRSCPLGSGGACSAEGVNREDVYSLGLRFFSFFQMKGPASIEFKQSPTGELYVIEPTIGREDFYVQTCIKNSVDIPYIAYAHQAGIPILAPQQKNRYIWVDFEKDSLMLVESLIKERNIMLIFQLLSKKLCFAFWDIDDPIPFMYHLYIKIKKAFRKLSSVFI